MISGSFSNEHDEEAALSPACVGRTALAYIVWQYFFLSGPDDVFPLPPPLVK